MDASRVDVLTRALATAPSRRATLRLLVGGSLGSVFASHFLAAASKEDKKGKGRKKKGPKKPSPPNYCAGLATPSFCGQLIGGSGASLIPQGNPGELSVVISGPYDGSSFPFIVRNNTGNDVHDLSATATVRNSAGQLIGSGDDLGITPNVVPAGGIAMGYIYFGSVDYGPDARFSVSVTASGAANWKYENERDLVFDEANSIDGRIVGAMSNGYTQTVEEIFSFELTCFDGAGNILLQDTEFSELVTLAPGQQAFFQFSSYEPLNCPYFLITGSGFTP